MANKLGNSNSINGLCSIQGRLNEGENHIERTTWEKFASLYLPDLYASYRALIHYICLKTTSYSKDDWKGLCTFQCDPVIYYGHYL